MDLAATVSGSSTRTSRTRSAPAPDNHGGYGSPSGLRRRLRAATHPGVHIGATVEGGAPATIPGEAWSSGGPATRGTEATSGSALPGEASDTQLTKPPVKPKPDSATKPQHAPPKTEFKKPRSYSPRSPRSPWDRSGRDGSPRHSAEIGAVVVEW